MDISKHKYIGFALPRGVTSAPSKLMVSVCLAINSKSELLTVDNGFNELYDSFRGLRNSFITSKISVRLNRNEISATAMPYSFSENYEPVQIGPNDLAEIGDYLWNNIFPKRIGTNGVKYRPVNPEIDPLLSKESLPNLSAQINFVRSAGNMPKGASAEDHTEATLVKVRKHAENQRLLGRREKLRFVNEFKKEMRQRLSSELGITSTSIRELASQLSKQRWSEIESNMLMAYVDSEKIELDDFLHCFNAISSDANLMRIMGLIHDFEIILPETPAVDNEKPYTLDFSCEGLGDDILIGSTQVIGINKGGRYAYLVKDTPRENNGPYFTHSIFEPSDSEIISYDPLAKEKDLTVAATQNSQPNELDKNAGDADVMTRGILYTHPKLHELIKPLEYPADGMLTADYVTNGHRIGTQIISESFNGLFSLTARSFELATSGTPLITQGRSEGSIHFDSPMMYTDESTQEMRGMCGDILFEYSGELLSLKSAFSRSQLVRASENDAADASNDHDDGMNKARARLKRHLRFTKFPFNEKLDPIAANATYVCSYGLPKGSTFQNTPKLRYGWQYQFVIHKELLNGYALPLLRNENAPDFQLTIQDLILAEIGVKKSSILTDPFTYLPLENSKPPMLFHTRADAVNKTKAVHERESLETIAVLSQSASGEVFGKRSRHLLPQRITFEQAFMYDLFKEKSPRESFQIKNQHNCPFGSRKDFEAARSSCFECKSSYCGGTQMEEFYETDQIIPRYIADPTVGGFNLELFWDIELSDSLKLGDTETDFGGTPGFAPQSCRVIVLGSRKGLEIKKVEKKKIEIALKKGMTVYARLTNKLLDSQKSLLKDVWTEQGFGSVKNLVSTKKDDAFLAENKIRPKILTLVHAVAEPLITPQLHEFYSPDHVVSTDNLIAWLRLKHPATARGLSIYDLRRNVISMTPGISTDQAIRIITAGGSLLEEASRSSLAKTRVKSTFERLDATGFTDRRVTVIPNVVPTGNLELLMRKEEYADDPAHFVFDPRSTPSAVNHIPTEPLVPFSDLKKNSFSVDKKIEYSEPLIAQLKDASNMEPIASKSDPFRNVKTAFNMDLDLKTHRFEEREYYLRNTSKFVGFFSDKADADNAELDNFVLPKRSFVENSPALRFKVMVLSSKPPKKPDVAFATTTIHETRRTNGKNTSVIQRPISLTVYLNRDREPETRVGVIVNHPLSTYKDIYEARKLYSRVGRDIVSDNYSPRSTYIRFDGANPEQSDIFIPKGNPYDAVFDRDLGIVSYAPKFDFEKQLWKFEVDLNIRTASGAELHNPFVNLSLIHHQPFALNYNAMSWKALAEVRARPLESLSEFKQPGDSDLNACRTRLLNELVRYSRLENDCRISEPTRALWGYLGGSRAVRVYLDEPRTRIGIGDNWGIVDLKLFLDRESLHNFDPNDISKLRSNFIMVVEGTYDGDDSRDRLWYPLLSRRDDGIKDVICDNKWQLMHPLIDKNSFTSSSPKATDRAFGNLGLGKRVRFRKFMDPCGEPLRKFEDFRVRLLEVEWFENKSWDQFLAEDPDFMMKDILENEKMRVRYVELIY